MSFNGTIMSAYQITVTTPLILLGVRIYIVGIVIHLSQKYHRSSFLRCLEAQKTPSFNKIDTDYSRHHEKIALKCIHVGLER